MTPDQERFWSKVDVRGPGECWLWTDGVDDKGYGRFWFEGKPRRAHRVAWLFVHGQWPRQTIDHLCDTPGCQNVVDHMEDDVSEEENNRRRDERRGNPASRTEVCVNGHLFSGENLYINSRGHRVCRACSKAKSARYRARKEVSEQQ